jgi:predicted dinucleotide-binding enzyme
LIRDVGLRPVRAGGLEAADVVDGVTRLWFALAFSGGWGRHHGLRIVGVHQ